MESTKKYLDVEGLKVLIEQIAIISCNLNQKIENINARINNIISVEDVDNEFNDEIIPPIIEPEEPEDPDEPEEPLEDDTENV